MTGSTIYAAQKTREAVNCLALLEKPLRERLCDAIIALHILTADKIPDDALQEKLEALIAKVDEGMKPDDKELRHLTDGDVSTAARQIVELFESCVKLYTKNPNLYASS
jgi:hypothetical protein